MLETDIINYNGVIAPAGLLWPLISSQLDLKTNGHLIFKYATKEEVDLYNKRPES